MLKKILLTILMSIPAFTLAQTVSNTDYIQKQIDLALEEADFSYEEIKSLFNDNPSFNTTCFPSGVSENDVDARLNMFRPVPENYLIKFSLNKKALGFDLQALVSVQDMAEAGGFDQEIYADDQQLNCVDSKLGCSQFFYESPEISLTHNPNDEEKVKLSKSWRFQPIDKYLMYAEYSISLSASETNWIGAKTGTERQTDSFLCVMEAVEEI